MRILIDGRMLCRPKSGIGYYLENLLVALGEVDQANEYTVAYLPEGPEGPYRRFSYPNFHASLLWMPNKLSTRLFRDSSLPYQAMRRLNHTFDLVHEPAFEPLPRAPRSVVTIHDMILFRLADHFEPAFAARYQRRIRASVENASQVIAVSQSTRRDIIDILHVSPDKVHAIPLGVRREEFQLGVPEVEQNAELKRVGIMRPYLLSIGDLYRRKNNITLVRAFARLPAMLREAFQLVIAGAPKEREVLNELHTEIARSGLEGKVLIPGYVEESLRPLLIARAATLLYPSCHEGFGLPPLEAMTCGVPVICSDNTSIPEVVGGAGILIPHFTDPEAWVGPIEQVLTDQEFRATLVQAGRSRVQEFSWERTAIATLEVYALAAEGKTGR